MVTTVRREALVARSPERMFGLVDEVERYPERFDWCRGVDVLERGATVTAARLHVRAAGVEFSFATRNELEPPTRMRLSMIEGPLKRLDGDWHFDPYGDTGCRVRLELRFEPRSRLLGLATTLAFQRLADRLVADFSAVAMAGA